MQWTEASADDFDSIDREGEKEGGRERKGDGREGRRSTVRERREKLSSSKAIQNSPKKRGRTLSGGRNFCALGHSCLQQTLSGCGGTVAWQAASDLPFCKNHEEKVTHWNRGEMNEYQTRHRLPWYGQIILLDLTNSVSKRDGTKRKRTLIPPPPPFDGCIRKRLPRDWMCAD